MSSSTVTPMLSHEDEQFFFGIHFHVKDALANGINDNVVLWTKRDCP